MVGSVLSFLICCVDNDRGFRGIDLDGICSEVRRWPGADTHLDSLTGHCKGSFGVSVSSQPQRGWGNTF